MSRSMTVVTGFEDTATQSDILNKKILKIKNKLVVFLPAHLHEPIAEIRKTFDPNLQNTILKIYDPNNTDAFHLYYKHLKQINTFGDRDISHHLLKLNRLAFIRDLGMQNPFKTSNFIWVDNHYDISFEEIKNDTVNKDHVVHFGYGNNQTETFINDSIFCIPQEMAWSYYYWNKLEHQEFIYNQKIQPYFFYFQQLHNKLDCITEVVFEDPNFYLVKTAPSNESNFIEHQNKSMVAVINHYQNDTSWSSRLKCKSVIYNKNPQDIDKYEINLPNLGFDTIVYLRYIIDNYENLPDYMCFLQDDPFFHCMDVIQKINSFEYDKEFLALSTSYYLGGHDWQMTETYAARIGLEFVRPLKMITSCQCIVSKKKVLKRSKSFYELLVSTIDKTVKCVENYAIENLWPTILSFNEELEPCLNCKGYGDRQ